MSEVREDPPAAAETAAPAVADPPAPAVEVAADPTPPVPAAEPAAAPTEPAVSPAAEAPAPLENLLSGGIEKPADAPAPEVPATETAPAYEWQPFALPEDMRGAALNEERVTALRDALMAADLSPQDRGQRLLDLHIAEMRSYDERALERQIETFQGMQRGWIDQFKGDREIGGAAARTHIQLANGAIRRFASEEHRYGQRLSAQQLAENAAAKERKEAPPHQTDHSAFMDMLKVTGAVNHPEMARHLSRVEKTLREPARAAPAIGPSAVPRDIGNRRPSAQPGNPGRGRAQLRDFYDHSRSQEVNGSAR